MSYETVAQISGITALILFCLLFAGVLIYTFWPGNRKRFEHAARIPLDNDPQSQTDRS